MKKSSRKPLLQVELIPVGSKEEKEASMQKAIRIIIDSYRRRKNQEAVH